MRKHYNNAVNKIQDEFGNQLNINLFRVKLDSLENISQNDLDKMTEFIINTNSTGFFALSFRQCKLIKDALNKRGYKIPRDISAFSVTWEEETMFDLDFNIDNVKFSIFNLGYYGMDKLIRHLEGEINIPSTNFLEYETFENGSIMDMNKKKEI